MLEEMGCPTSLERAADLVHAPKTIIRNPWLSLFSSQHVHVLSCESHSTPLMVIIPPVRG